MKKNILLISVLSVAIAFVGCSNNKALTTSQSNSTEDNYETVGKIIDFDNEGVHILTRDIAEIYKVDLENQKDFYLGETVAVEKIGEGGFKLVKCEIKEFEQRYTNMGDIIIKASGKVKKVDDKKVIIETKDGELEFQLYEGMTFEGGTDVIVEYLDKEDGKILINSYDENTKINLIVKSIKRTESNGMMAIETEDDNNSIS
ncbi:hypothetical protein SH2C18_42290 [Clostridium sediminicola]|uniref:hypothetical protein n=1 Tax=Clostridium sediminicola TaxID=3114879 RepID=UPI0031F227B5